MTTVLHILPADLARGAQRYAHDLRLALDGASMVHRTMTLFDGSEGVLEPDMTLGVPSGFPRRAGFDPRAAARLRRTLRRERPAVVVAHGGESLKYAVAAGAGGRRLIYYKIGITGSGLGGARQWLQRRLVGRAGTIAGVSEACAAEARDFGARADRVRVIPNGRDPAVFSPRRHGTSSQPVRIGFVGHLTASKRPLLFVDLVRDLRSTGVAVRASMAGSGPLLAEVREIGRTADIDVLGNVDDVPALLRDIDIFVFTSVAEGEGMPGVLIEAGLAGLPVVTTDVPGARDVVEHGRTGFVVAVEDHDELRRATRALLEDPALRERFGREARARCERSFSMEASAHAWTDLLHAVADDRCPSGP